MTNTRNTRVTRAGMVVSFAIGGMIGLAMAAGALAAVAPDVVPEIKPGQETSKLYEDGSYILSVGEFSLVGCAPVHPWNGELVTGWCMDGGTNPLGYIDRGAWVWAIGVDSPWEDFLPTPLDSLVYWLIETFIK